MTVIQTITDTFQKAVVQNVITTVYLMPNHANRTVNISKRCNMNNYFQKMLPHIKFAVWFAFYFLGLFFIAEYVATSAIAKLIVLALWVFGYPYSKEIFK